MALAASKVLGAGPGAKLTQTPGTGGDEGLSEASRRGEGKGWGVRGKQRAACLLTFIGLKFALLSPPPCVRSCALRARLLESRLQSYPSALLTAPDTLGGGRGRGVGSHHPPKRTHSCAHGSSEADVPARGPYLGVRALEMGTLLSQGKPEASGPAVAWLAVPFPTG